MTEDLITVIFKVASQIIFDDYTNVDNPECSIALFGSIPELGSWKIPTMAKDLKQERDGDNACFQVETRIPSGSSFEWSWLALNKQYGPVRIEKRKVRRFTVGKVPVTIHTKWNEETEVVVPIACNVKVSTTYKTSPDQVLAVSGSSSLLGKWNTGACIFAQEIDDCGTKIWQAFFLADLDIYIEWRWVLIDRNTGDVTWERRENRHLLVNVDTVDMDAPWGGESIVMASTVDFTKFYTWDVIESIESGEMSFTLKRLVNSEMPYCPSRERVNLKVAEMARIILLKKVWEIRPPSPGMSRQSSSGGMSKVFPNYRKYNKTRTYDAGIMYSGVSVSTQNTTQSRVNRRHNRTKDHRCKEFVVATAAGYKFGRDVPTTVPLAQHELETLSPNNNNHTDKIVTHQTTTPTFSIHGHNVGRNGSIRHISVHLDDDHSQERPSTSNNDKMKLLANVPFDYIEFGEFNKVHFAMPVGRIQRADDLEQTKEEERKRNEQKRYVNKKRTLLYQILYPIGEFLKILYEYHCL